MNKLLFHNMAHAHHHNHRIISVHNEAMRQERLGNFVSFEGTDQVWHLHS